MRETPQRIKISSCKFKMTAVIVETLRATSNNNTLRIYNLSNLRHLRSKKAYTACCPYAGRAPHCDRRTTRNG